MADSRRQRPHGAHPLYWASFRTVPPDDWAVRPVSELATTFKGKLPTRVLDKPNGRTKPYLLMDGLRGGTHVYTEETHLPSVNEEDSVLIADGSKSGFAVRGVSGVLGSTLLAFRAREKTHPSVLFHLLSSLFPFLNTATTGTAIPHLDQDLLLRLPLGVPTAPDEQAAIARILDAVDTALERTRAAVEGAHELKRACLQRFFYDALGDAAYADRPKKKLPRGWALVPTRQLLSEDPKNGLSPESSAQPPGIPSFSIAAIRDGRVDLATREHLKYAHVEEGVAERYRVRRGDVLIVRGNANAGLVGAAGMVERFPDGCIYPDITMRVAFRPEGVPRVSGAFAVLAWNHALVHNQVLRRAKTSNGTLKINSRDVNQIVMPVPPDEDQAEICSTIGAVDGLIDALAAVGRAQQELKKSLMHDLLTGRVRVRDAPKVAAS